MNIELAGTLCEKFGIPINKKMRTLIANLHTLNDPEIPTDNIPNQIEQPTVGDGYIRPANVGLIV